MDKIIIKFESKNQIVINLLDNAATRTYTNMLKHLQHVDVPQYVFDNPYNWNIQNAVSELEKYASRLNIALPDLPFTQRSLNKLHQIYENGYDGTNDWLHFHESIHVIEYIKLENTLENVHALINYRELGGKVEQPITQDHLDLITTDLSIGDCCIDWTELGKTPYAYWSDSEPANITRMCELAKPWLTFKPKIKILLDDVDLIPYDISLFHTWFGKFKDQWCNHWGLPDWSDREIFGRIPIGHITDIDKFKDLLKANDRIVRLTLN